MAFENQEARLKHWSIGWTRVNQGDSNPVPFCGHEGRFRGKEALEIGPGEGRQYKAVKDRVLSYAIADISQEVLDCPVFDEVDWKLRIQDLRFDSFSRKFDIVHFWYVLHHVPMIEVFDFFNFVHNHLHQSGLVMFNTPYLDFDLGCYSDDGVNTTCHEIADIVNLLDPLFFIESIDGTKYERSNGHIYIGKRK